jgi:hypothetical protein
MVVVVLLGSFTTDSLSYRLLVVAGRLLEMVGSCRLPRFARIDAVASNKAVWYSGSSGRWTHPGASYAFSTPI